MFQDTLLIIKSDYMHRRKAVLIYLLQQGFQIQGHRKILFSPELAAEFYQDISDDPCFMFQVILISKGKSEAFILAKENAVEDLINSMVCYFGSCVEMDRNVHVTRCIGKVKKDISFIFPNYISEPIYCPEQLKFGSNNPFVTSLLHEVYDITTTPERDPHKSWKEKLAEWLISSNKALPTVSNQCAHNPSLNVREIAQQTKVTAFKHVHALPQVLGFSKSSGLGFSTDGTSLNVTSSSCVTCSDFGSSDDCFAQQQQNMDDIIKAKTAPLKIIASSSSTNHDGHNEAEGAAFEEIEEALNIEGGDVNVLAEAFDKAAQLNINASNANQSKNFEEKLKDAGAGDASMTIMEKPSAAFATNELGNDDEIQSPVQPTVEAENLPEVLPQDESQLHVEQPGEIENVSDIQVPVESESALKQEEETLNPEQVEPIITTTEEAPDEMPPGE